MSGEVPLGAMQFSGEPTADFDTAGDYLARWYVANHPDLNRDPWHVRLLRGVAGYGWGDRDRDIRNFYLGLINEVLRIEGERVRQVGRDSPISDRLLTATVDVRLAGRTTTHLDFPRGVGFAEGTRALLAARAALDREYEGRYGCPAARKEERTDA